MQNRQVGLHYMSCEAEWKTWNKIKPLRIYGERGVPDGQPSLALLENMAAAPIPDILAYRIGFGYREGCPVRSTQTPRFCSKDLPARLGVKVISSP